MGPRRALALGVVVMLFILDRSTKYWIETKVSLYDSIEIIPSVFNIVHARNRGAAFGILNTSPEWIRLTVLVGFALCILALIASMLWQATRENAPGTAVNRMALSLVLGGALGNLYDRILKGSVTDFLQVFLGSYEWPSFNVADSAITVGATLMAIDLLFLSRKQEPHHNAPEAH